jgi:F-type H+-transporting ATPase subunit alpha
LFFSGVRPAINAGLSVSRVGGSAQIKAMKKVSGTLRLDLASYRELEAFAQFGSDLDAATQAKLNRGARTVEVLKQDLNKPLPVEKQVAILYALTKGFLDDIPLQDIRRFEAEFHTWLDHNRKELLDHIVQTKELPADSDMAAAINEFKKTFAVSE